MYLVEIDQTLNRLHVVFTGDVDKKQARSFPKHIESRIGELEEGFHVLTDISGVRNLSVAATFFIRKAMDCYSTNGIAKVVRIVSHLLDSTSCRVFITISPFLSSLAKALKGR